MDCEKDRKTVLIAEDEIFIRMDANYFLTEAGLDVIEAKNAGEAEKLLRNTTVDVLFTDIEMPGSNLNGLELAALVGKEWPSIPVLVTSGKVIPSNDERSFGFLPKPYLARDVIAWIKKAVEQS